VGVTLFDPIFFIGPLSSILVSGFLLYCFKKKGKLTLAVLVLAALAYFGAIIAKAVFQYFTAATVVAGYGSSSIETGLYYGAQTSLLEVGGAYLIARHWKKHVPQRYGFSYGASMGFFENGILLGLFTLINLAYYYYLLGLGGNSLSTYIYDILVTSSPALFYPPLKALPIVGLSVLERTSSLMIHIAWGFLVVTAVNQQKLRYLGYAIPMGLVDALVPFSSEMGVAVFELVVFLIALLSLLLSLRVNHGLRIGQRQ
jgi:uncharacterized membrane protein YhfC